MERIAKKIELGDGVIKHKVILKDVQTATDEMSKNFRRLAFIKEFLEASFTSVVYCGPGFFDTMKMYHQDGRWVIEMDATETNNND